MPSSPTIPTSNTPSPPRRGPGWGWPSISDPASPQAPAPISEIPHPTSLPSLSASDESLLEHYIFYNFNLDLLAEHTQLPILRLIRWANLPHIAEYLKAIDALCLRQSTAEDLADRRAAIDALKQILTTSEDPIERRRAANAILRTLNSRKPLPEGGVGVGSRDSEHKSRASSRPAPTSQIPHPTSLPSPSLAAEDALSTVLSALKHNDNPDENSGLATLHTFCAKGATIDGQPVAENLSDFLDDLEEETAGRLNLSSCIPGIAAETTPTSVRFTSYQLCAHDAFTIAEILLRRDSESAPFLITAINFTKRNTS